MQKRADITCAINKKNETTARAQFAFRKFDR